MSSDCLNNEMFATPLTKLYFSQKNIDALQSAIQYRIYKTHNIHIDKQSETELMLIMRSIFLQYSANRPDNIREQIEALNQLVLDYCIPNVHNEAVAYLKYKNDVTTLAIPEARPVYDNTKGSKTLELKPWF